MIAVEGHDAFKAVAADICSWHIPRDEDIAVQSGQKWSIHTLDSENCWRRGLGHETREREYNVIDSTTDHTCVHVEISLIVWLFDSLMLSHQLLSWAREVITDNNDVRLEREILFSPSTDYCVWLPSPHHPQQPARTELKASCLWLALSDSEQVFYISSDTREGRESWSISHEYQTLVSTGTNHPPPALNTFIKSWTKKLDIVCICSNEGYKSGELRQSCDGVTWDNVHAGT